MQRSVGKVSGGEWVEGPTKTYRERKLRVIKAALDPVVALCEGKGPDDLVFTNGHTRIGTDNYLSADQVLGALRAAAKKVLPERKQAIKVHDLRDTHASILIGYLGWDAVSVARRLGHRDANVTLSRYAHWFPEREDELMEAMEGLASRSAA